MLFAEKKGTKDHDAVDLSHSAVDRTFAHTGLLTVRTDGGRMVVLLCQLDSITLLNLCTRLETLTFSMLIALRPLTLNCHQEIDMSFLDDQTAARLGRSF